MVATHEDLEQNVRNRTFREDLFYRLNVFVIKVPGLNEHIEDIPSFVARFTTNQPRKMQFTDGVINDLMTAEWPRNVRQLRTVIDRVAILSDDNPVTETTVRQFLTKQARSEPDVLDAIAGTLLRLEIGEVADRLTALENAVIMRAMKKTSGNKSAAARMLGVNRKIIERRQQRIKADLDESNQK